jgi:predicted RNase H-like nuclease (RuvC/YqgF family)
MDFPLVDNMSEEYIKQLEEENFSLRMMVEENKLKNEKLELQCGTMAATISSYECDMMRMMKEMSHMQAAIDLLSHPSESKNV